MRRPNPTVLAAIALGATLLLIAAVLLFQRGNPDQDRLGNEESTQTADAGTPEGRCAAQRTYDAIKRELFRQAAQVRGSDQAVFDRLAAYAAVRMEGPVLRSHDEDLGTVGCSGVLTLDLPPGVAVVGGRRSLSAEVGYILQRAADGTGDVVMLEGVDPIVVPLATLARTGNNMPPPAPPDPAAATEPQIGTPPPAEAPPVQQPPTAPVVEPSPAPEPPPQTESPSFNCRYARTRGEIAVCNDPGLASLDRQMASQYNRAVGSANSQQRELLQRTRNRFLGFRDRCRSDGCIADAYRGRMREISDIMADRWRG